MGEGDADLGPKLGCRDKFAQHILGKLDSVVVTIFVIACWRVVHLVVILVIRAPPKQHVLVPWIIVAFPLCSFPMSATVLGNVQGVTQLLKHAVRRKTFTPCHTPHFPFVVAVNGLPESLVLKRQIGSSGSINVLHFVLAALAMLWPLGRKAGKPQRCRQKARCSANQSTSQG
jgi:hypothetical protein